MNSNARDLLMTVPVHPGRTLKKSLVRAILRDANLSEDALIDLLRSRLPPAAWRGALSKSQPPWRREPANIAGLTSVNHQRRLFFQNAADRPLLPLPVLASVHSPVSLRQKLVGRDAIVGPCRHADAG